MNEELTYKQQKIYKSIKKFIKENKYSPTIRELCELNDISSPATMWVHLQKIMNKGFITYKAGASRTIQVIK